MSSPRYERLPMETLQNVSKRNSDHCEMESEVCVDTNIGKPPQTKMFYLAVSNMGLILLYLSLSICLTFYQSWLIKRYKFPLTIVLYHLVIKLMLSTLLRHFYKLITGKPRILIDWRTSVRKISPIGFASGIDIGFSNWGLELVQISLYTMTKSSTIIFILFFAILLGLENKSWSLIAIIVLIAGGLFMFTYKSTKFDIFGFSFLLFASFTSGIRWSFAQLIMQKSKLGLHNPIDMIFHMQPWMIAAIIPFTLGFEGRLTIELFESLSGVPIIDMLLVFIKITVGAMIAFLMETSEFMVLSSTSSLTLSICGIFKDVCQLVLAVEVIGDELSTINILGLVLCLGGIFCHVAHKYATHFGLKNEESFTTSNVSTSKDKSTSVTFRNNAQSIPLLTSNDGNNSDSEGSHNSDNQNASEVIFDILKRRDTARRILLLHRLPRVLAVFVRISLSFLVLSLVNINGLRKNKNGSNSSAATCHWGTFGSLEASQQQPPSVIELRSPLDKSYSPLKPAVVAYIRDPTHPEFSNTTWIPLSILFCNLNFW